MLDDKNSHEIGGNIFSRKKSLLTVQQYAASQGISAGVVNECAKLGVVQIRKHKNKMFIVDLPLDAGKNAKQDDDANITPIDTVQQAQRISTMVSKIFQPAGQLNNSVAPITKPAPENNSVQIEKIKETQKPQPVTNIPDVKVQTAIPDLNLFAQEEKQAPVIKVEKFQPLEPEFKVSLHRRVYDYVKATSANKIIFAMLMAAMILSYAAYLKTDYQNKIQQRNLKKAFDSVTKLLNEKDASDRKARMYQMENENWRSEVQKNQKSIASLQVELVQTKKRLSQTQDDLSQTQQNHVDTLKQLNQQIQQITDKVKTKIGTDSSIITEK